ncbi:MAG: TonB-dependent receptor [Bacteroidales bacterium]|nr:TonB-dependent receptor [Bacteroidales bacterium]
MKYSYLKKRMIAAAALIIASAGFVEAQNVHGRVVDAGDGEAMPFVNVALMRQADTVFVRGATTGPDGSFDITATDSGVFLLRATCIGYQPFIESIDVRGKSVLHDITMHRTASRLDEVQVVSDRPLYAMDGEKNLYNTHDDPSVQTGTASDALQNAPGVEVDAEGNITLRGVSSVEIWINDRPSHMQAEALKQYIKQLPANAIERIEVITNPSARYSTSGGVINIVTNQSIARNELLCFGVRGRTMPSVSPWLSYVYANEKFDINLYLNADYTHHRSERSGTNTLLTSSLDTSRHQRYESQSLTNTAGGYAGLNLNWRLDSMTTLAAWMGFYPFWSHDDNTGHYLYREYQPTLTDLSYDESIATRGFVWGGYMGAWFEHRYDEAGRKLTLSLNGNVWGSRNSNDQTRRYTTLVGADLVRRSGDRGLIPSGDLALGYTLPLRHGMELEVGAEAELSGDASHELLELLDAAGHYVADTLRSVDAVVNGQGANLYATLLKRWGAFTAKVGLRAEQEWQQGRWHRIGGVDPCEVDTALFGLVPSLHLSYVTKDFQSYSLSYTRRFSNPDAGSLTTYREYADYSFSTGNPALLRSYTHNLDAAWSKYFAGFGNVGVSAYLHANTNEVGTTTLAGYDPYFGTQLVNYTQPVNIGSSHTEGIEANITYRPTAMLNVRLNASVFNYGYRYGDFADSKLSWSARLNVWAKLWGWLEVFANAHYTSPRIGLYSLSVANKGIDLGLSSDLLDRRLSIFLNVNDIFGMAEWGQNTTAPQYQTTGSSRYDSRYVSLGLTWRIGKMELESKARQGAGDSNAPQM